MTRGIFIGKFMPFHRGHLSAILEASTQCDELYVVVSHDDNFMKERCAEYGIKEMPLELRMMWINKELQDFDHIKVIGVDETDVPMYPNGWMEWSALVREALIEAGVPQRGWADKAINPVAIDYCFGSETGYDDQIVTYFNAHIKYVAIDIERKRVNISATELVKNIYKHWDMIPAAVRPHFVKKVLVVGTESCGKTTVVRKLAKHFLTSWSEEYGKWYQKNEMGDYDGNWQVHDFEIIAMRQIEQDREAYRTANKVAFVDTDAIVTDYYLDMYLGEKSPMINVLKDLEKDTWDLVFMLQPTVAFVQDGTRWEENRDKRWELHERLKRMFDEVGVPYIEMGGDYHFRFTMIAREVEDMLGE